MAASTSVTVAAIGVRDGDVRLCCRRCHRVCVCVCVYVCVCVCVCVPCVRARVRACVRDVGVCVRVWCVRE